MRFVAPKGSDQLDGTSLTVNEVGGDTFGVNLISHTQSVTSWGAAQVGDRVNLEIGAGALRCAPEGYRRRRNV